GGRRFAAAMADEAATRGVEFQMAFEVEWFVGRVGDGDGGREGEGISPACTGPAYGMTRLVELSGYGRELLAALDEQGVPVEQFHPERSEEHTSELQSRFDLVCRLLLEKKKNK